jgi:hypothetical protein
MIFMKRLKLLIYLFIFFSFLNLVLATECLCGRNKDADACNPCTQQDLAQKTPTEISQASPEETTQYFDSLNADQRKALTADQLAAIDPAKYGDLGQYNPAALKGALEKKRIQSSVSERRP